jgi:hypothetical protein
MYSVQAALVPMMGHRLDVVLRTICFLPCPAKTVPCDERSLAGAAVARDKTPFFNGLRLELVNTKTGAGYGN